MRVHRSAPSTPHLFPLSGRVPEDTTPDALAGHDALIPALPHGHVPRFAAALPDETVVIDYGAISGSSAPGTGPRSMTRRMPGPGPMVCRNCRCRTTRLSAPT